MADAELEKTTVTVSISNEKDMKFSAVGEVIKFDGFLHVYLEGTDEEIIDNETSLLPPVKVQDALQMKEATATERFTQRPSRYSEASLVRKLEELGIGRPSTYAPTISTIQNREYVEKSNIEGTERQYNILALKKEKISDTQKTEITGTDKGKLIPTDTGVVVNDFLIEYFPGILDYNFTANIEKEFDQIAEGEENWTKLIDKFYKVFHPIVESATNTQTDHKVGERILGVDPKSGRQVSVKIGRFGPMVQIGVQEEEEKPQFAGLQKTQSITTITLEEALKLFELPRSVGEFEGKDVSVGTGRFGPYIKHNGKFISLPKGYDPYSVDLDSAISLIEDKRQKDAEKIIKTFPEDADLQILNGRYGPYIAYQKTNYKIPKGVVPADLDFDAAMKIVKATGEKPATKTKAKSKKK